MLTYTGHPLVDVGVAVITAFAEKDDPAEVTQSDLATIADYIEMEYGRNPMKSFLTVIFPNSGFTQPAFDKQPEKRASYANDVLRGWREDIPFLDAPCTFFGTPAVLRVYRETLPLIGAASGFNFYAEGQAGLPISGAALLAIQAFPLGGVKCSGRVLILHADDPDLTYQFVSEALSANRRYLSLAAQASKMDDSKHPRTQIIHRLLAAEAKRVDHERCSVTAYHLTNYGTNASVDIYHVPLQIMSFLTQATDATYRAAWERLVGRGWEHTAVDAERDVFDAPTRRNVLYEDLFALPTEARRFLRTYMLRRPPLQKASKEDPRVTYRLAADLDLVSWPLTMLFLQEVMNVEPDRIEAIRTMADKLADYIAAQNDIRLFRTFLYGRNRGQDYQELRNRLIRADVEIAPRQGPLFTLDEFLAVFENSDDRYWWTMARDLLLIRMIEQLHAQEKIAPFKDVIEAATQQESEELE